MKPIIFETTCPHCGQPDCYVPKAWVKRLTLEMYGYWVCLRCGVRTRPQRLPFGKPEKVTIR